MIKKFSGIHLQMDEMLLAKQQRAGFATFWILLLSCHALYFFLVLGLSQPFSQTWPLALLTVLGTVCYVVLAFRARIPILPRIRRGTLLCILLLPALLMGAFIGVRNVFFLYAQNMAAYSLGGKLLMTAQIAGLLFVEFALLNGFDFLVLFVLDRIQDRRISRQISEESEEEEETV